MFTWIALWTWTIRIINFLSCFGDCTFVPSLGMLLYIIMLNSEGFLFSYICYFIEYSGEQGIGPKSGKPLHYKGSFYHHIVKGYIAQVCLLILLLDSSSIQFSGWAWLSSGLSISYPCLCCRIQGWWSRLLFLWYSFKVVLTKLYILEIY